MDDGSVEDGEVATLRKTATKLVRASGELFPAEHLSKALKGVESAVVRPAITRLEAESGASAATGSADARKQRLRAQCGALHRQLVDKKANEDGFLSNVMTFFREEDAKAMNHRMQIQDQLDQFEELRAHQAQQAKEEEALKACLELMVLYAEDAKSRNTFLIDTLTQLLSCQPTMLPGNPPDDTLVQSWGLAAQAAYIRLVNDCQFCLEKMLARRNMFLDRLEDSKKENKEHALQMAVLMQTTTNSREVLDEYKRRYFWDSITHSFKPPSRRIGETGEASSSKPQPAAHSRPLPSPPPQPGLALPLRSGEPMPEVQEPMPSPRTPSEASPSPRPQQESLPSLPEEQHPPPADQSQDSPAPASVDPASPSEGSFSRSAALASEGFTPPKGSSPEHSRSPPPSQVLLEPIAVPSLPPPPPLPLPRVSDGEGAATAHAAQAAQAAMRCQRHTYSLGSQPSRMYPQGCVSFSPPGVVMKPAGAPTFSGWQVAQLPGHGSSYLPEQVVPQPRRHLAYSPPPRQWQQLSAASPRLPSPVPPPRWTYVSPRRSTRSTSAGADSACRARGRHSSFEPRTHGQSMLGAAAQASLPGSMLCPTPGSAWSGSMHCPAPPPALGHILGVRSGSAAYPPGQARPPEPIERRGRSPVPARRVVLAPQQVPQAAQPLAPRLCSQSPPRQVYLVRSPSPVSQACITPRGTSPTLAQSSSYVLPVTRGSAPPMVGRGRASGRTPSPCYPARMAKVSTSPCNIAASGEGVLLTPRYAGAVPPAASVQGTHVPDATIVARGRSPGLVAVAPSNPQYCVRQGASCAVRSPTPPAAVVAAATPRTGSPVFVRYHLQPRTGGAGPQILPAQALSVQAPMVHGPCSVTMTSANNLRAG